MCILSHIDGSWEHNEYPNNCDKLVKKFQNRTIFARVMDVKSLKMEITS